MAGGAYQGSGLAGPTRRSDAALLSRQAELALGSVCSREAAVTLGSGHTGHTRQAAGTRGALGAGRARGAVLAVIALHRRRTGQICHLYIHTLPEMVC